MVLRQVSNTIVAFVCAVDIRQRQRQKSAMTNKERNYA